MVFLGTREGSHPRPGWLAVSIPISRAFTWSPALSGFLVSGFWFAVRADYCNRKDLFLLCYGDEYNSQWLSRERVIHQVGYLCIMITPPHFLGSGHSNPLTYF